MRRLVILVAVLIVPACSGGGDDGDDEIVDCNLEDRDDEFVVGLEKIATSGHHYRLMQATPAPPGRYTNRWTIHVTDGGGAPVAGATLLVEPAMPDHGHGTSVEPVITESTTVLGEYDIDMIDLFMPALWVVTIQAMPAATSAVTFSFCIPG